MDLKNSFTVDVGVERAWQVLTDIPAIAPCLPGAQLQEVDGDDFKGIVKVKVGPIVAQYKGTATIEEADENSHRIVLRAEGRETRGQGNANALITATLTGTNGATDVVVDTELTVTGKVAQFGRGVMAEVSAKLMDQFAANLADTVLADTGPGEQVPDEPVAQGSASPKVEPGPDPEPIDLLGAAGAPTGKRLIPPLIAAVLAVLVIRWLVKRRRG